MKKLRADLKTRLKDGRFRHTAGVVKTASRLALRHGVSEARAVKAAWLHDCGKALDRAALKKLLGVAGADAQERALPPLWHAPVGALLARKIYGIKDSEILNAIRFHSTGAPKMTRLQKLLFVADYIEPGRPNWPELPALRRLAMRDLNLAFLEVLRQKMTDMIAHRRILHTRSIDAYHFALKETA